MNRSLPISFLLVLSLITLSATSCKRKKKKQDHVTDTVRTVSDNCHMERRLPKPIISDMRKAEVSFNWLSAKMNCEASDDSSKVSFNVMLRMKKDSAIWMNVTDPVIGISVARAFITRDSVKFVQFIPEQKCFAGDFAFLSQLLQTEVDYDMLQSLLVGNSASFYEEDEKLKASINNQSCTYVLSTVRKRKLRKVLEGQKQPDEPLQTITLEPSTFKILSILFLDANGRTFTADYSDFSKEDSLLIPHHAVFFGKGVQKSARLEVQFKKLTINNPLEFPFSFPDDCKPIIVPSKQGDH